MTINNSEIVMGAEAMCTVRFKRKVVTGKARLETEELQFRGDDLRLSIRFKDMSKVSVRDGTLAVSFPDGTAAFELGPRAGKWANAIEHPPSRLAKIGVKPDWRASAIDLEDEDFVLELRASVSLLSIGRVVKDSDAIFFGVTDEAQLGRMESLKASLKSNGAIWVIRPKGRPEISQGAVMAAGKRAGLVDVKVVRFSPTHTAEKYVIPVAARHKAR
ncbi:MAG TPA: hypothetical protein VNZ26_03945 [Vicinamibacterales bacterium]|nr:hypothetical protein [Vicinamibacterales bacterium]